MFSRVHQVHRNSSESPKMSHISPLRVIPGGYSYSSTIMCPVSLSSKGGGRGRVSRTQAETRGTFIGAEYALLVGVAPRNAPIFRGAFYVFLNTMQYQT